ncbi:tetratricopeptide repeat protein [Catenulispora sp. GP43]|uniref:ATP-binding protein n=1 Tax=Catenulispora sp. GP43 TaxID=3156263 RepID=UPI0035194D16
MPDPGQVGGLAELIDLLGELRAWAGQPSYRALAKQAGAMMRPPQNVSASTVVDAFKTGRSRLDMDLVMAIVRALGVVEEADVARWREAYVRAHITAKAATAPSGVLRQLPADLATFTGRAEALADLVRAAGSGADRVVVASIEGMGGVGKTQLAVHAAHELTRAGRYADAQLYVNLRGFDPERPPADPADVLDVFLRALRVPTEQIPADADERAAMFRDRLHGRQTLILLDNAADEEQARPLVPAVSGCLVLITSRRSMAGLDGCIPLELKAFPVSEAVELLAAVAGRDRVGAEPEAAERVADLCGRLPLAVALAAGRLRSRPGWSVRDLAERLATGGLDAVAAGGRSLRPVFDLSYGALSDPARRMFRLLGLHPGDHFTVEATAALAGVDVDTAAGLLGLLQEQHLVGTSSDGRHEMHDLLRRYALEHCPPEGDPEREAAQDRLLEHYLHTAYRGAVLQFPKRNPIVLPLQTAPPAIVPLADADAASQWFEAELASLRSLVLSAADTHPAAAWQLAWSLVGQYTKTGRYREMTAMQTVALLAAERLGHPEAQAYALDRRQWALCGMGDLDDAAADAERAVDIYRRIGHELYEAQALCGLVSVHTRRGDYGPGLEAARLALTLSRAQKTKAYQKTRAQSLNLVAWCMAHLDHAQAEAAVPLAEESLALFEELGDIWGQATVLDTMAYAYRACDKYLEAIATYERSLDLRTKFEAPVLRATTLLLVGELHHLRDDVPSARKAYEEVVDLATGSGSWVVAEAEDRLSELVESA